MEYDPEKIQCPDRYGWDDWFVDQAEFDAWSVSDDPWDDLATRLARDAMENYFEIRRGVWELHEFEVVALFNNNPYASDPFRRDQELLAIRGWLEERGFRELGFGLWPPTRLEDGTRSEQPGYTYAMIVKELPEAYDISKDLPFDIVYEIQERAFLEGQGNAEPEA
jgi:hypothetical protein